MSRVIFALDFSNVDEARRAAIELAPSLGMVKVGLELFVGEGPKVVGLGRDAGLPVFLDLKLHDIPETVERAVAQASQLGARVVTVHASGGPSMLERAVKRADKEGGTLSICAVTVLTSLDQSDLDAIGLAGSPRDAATKLARTAFDAGVRWFVCSPAEARSLRDALGPEATLVTPGVRPASIAGSAGATSGDQKRVATPEEAIRAGADWVVVGRPIRDAEDRLASARAIAAAVDAARGTEPRA